MGHIFVLAASKMEVDPVAKLFGVSDWRSDSTAGPITAGANTLEFFITGMGPKQAGKRATEIICHDPHSRTVEDPNSRRPDAVMVIGLCGGLTDSLSEMTIVTYSACVSAVNGGIPRPCTPQIYAPIAALLSARNVPCGSVIGITSPRIAVSRAEKLQLAETGAQVVDMESYEILLAAEKAGTPAAVVRVVSDSLDRKLPNLNLAINPDGSVNTGKAIRVMLGSPLLTARAYAASKRAARYLAGALRFVLSAELARTQ
jgi:hypothetical protein